MTTTASITQPKFRWPVSARRVIAAPPFKVWEVISSPGTLPLYHPFCEKNPVVEWSAEGAHDEVHYFNGRVLERRVTAWHDDVGYDLVIGRPGGKTSAVTWRVAPTRDGKSTVTISVYPHTLQHLSVIVRWLPHLMRLRPGLRSYLKSVLKGLDWFITRGKPVRRNQFGAHRWFSPQVSGS